MTCVIQENGQLCGKPVPAGSSDCGKHGKPQMPEPTGAGGGGGGDGGGMTNPAVESEAADGPPPRKMSRREEDIRFKYAATQPKTVASAVEVLCLVANDNELEAALQALKPDYRSIVNGVWCYFGRLTLDSAKTASVMVVKPKKQGAGGADGSQQALNNVSARVRAGLVVSIGVAMGVLEKVQDLGDVLVSTSVISYEVTRGAESSDPSYANRNARHAVDDVLALACEEAKPHCSESDATFQVYLGALASGDKLVTEAEQRNHILSLTDPLADRGEDVIGGEMEGMGVYSACAAKKLPWVIIKAVCDHGINKNALHSGTGNKASIQQRGTANAFVFLKHLLPIYDISSVDPHTTRNKCVRVREKDKEYSLLTAYVQASKTRDGDAIKAAEAELGKAKATLEQLQKPFADATKNLATNWPFAGRQVSASINGEEWTFERSTKQGTPCVSKERLAPYMSEDAVEDYYRSNRGPSKYSVKATPPSTGGGSALPATASSDDATSN